MKRTLAIICSACLAATAQAEWRRTVSALDTTLAGNDKLYLGGTARCVEWLGHAGETWLFQGSARFGMTDNCDAEIAMAHERLDPDHAESWGGMDDTLVGLRYSLLKDKTDPVGLIGRIILKVPTAKNESYLGSGEADATVMGGVSRTFGPVTCVANIGHTFTGEPKGVSYNDILQWAVEGVVPVTKGWSLSITAEGMNSRYDASSFYAWGGGGTRVTLGERVQLHSLFEWGLTDESYEWDASIGLTVALF